MEGKSFVKPSDNFKKVVKPISKIPAINKYIQGIFLTFLIIIAASAGWALSNFYQFVDKFFPVAILHEGKDQIDIDADRIGKMFGVGNDIAKGIFILQCVNDAWFSIVAP